MHPTDDSADAPFDGPSRSQLRREALEVFKLAESLAALSDAQLSRVPLDVDLLAEVRRTRAIKSHIAHKRQAQFLAKRLRLLDADAIDPIIDALAEDRSAAHRETAALHHVEAWRDRLIDEGDDALEALLALQPAADAQHLRQLARNARGERDRDKPPRAARELFRSLRELLAPE